MRYVIIGHGVAGHTAAQRIRSLDPVGAITLFSKEPDLFYYRVRLPEVVAGEVNMDRLAVQPREWYTQNAIDVVLGETVVEVDPAERRVVGDRGARASYDALLLAVGAKSFVPPVAGSDKPGVFTLRDAADARAIRAAAETTGTAILVGGGLLGLEAGYGLIRRGLRVHVVEMFDRLLPRQMCPTGARLLQNHLETLGFSFFLGARIKEIFGADRAEGLLLEDGRRLDGGLVLFSAGVRPNLDLAKSLGLQIERGVVVDDGLKTSLDGVWAAGDLVQHRGQVYGIWPAARDQGRVAGENMAGGSAVYTGTVMSNALKVAGVDLTSAGNIDPEDKLPQAVFTDGRVFRKIVMDQGRIAGFIFYGLKTGLRECQEALASGRDVSAFLAAMKEKEFDFSRLSA
jgi:nitrite reductase (NADH) large subunit